MSKEKNYRFYYSRKQNAVDEDMWGFTPQYTFVKTPDGYKQYSELCSIKGTKCNWEDAELVYETDKMPDIVIHEGIPELIAELEHRLSNCIELPVKIGDKIYVIPSETNYKINIINKHEERNKVYEFIVNEIRYNQYGYSVVSWVDNVPFFFLNGDKKAICECFETERFYDETWFTTLEEAEKKLGEMHDGR